jgi:hypothetical protein
MSDAEILTLPLALALAPTLRWKKQRSIMLRLVVVRLRTDIYISTYGTYKAIKHIKFKTCSRKIAIYIAQHSTDSAFATPRSPCAQ